MPSFDSGYYAFTALIPLLPDDTDWRLWRWSRQSSSVPHSLRELLSSLPTVDVPAGGGDKGGGAAVTRAIPFSGCDRTHFARLVVVEELAWNGRRRKDSLLTLLGDALGRSDRQIPDRLPCRYLLVAIDFDALHGDSACVENYLQELWASMEQEWTLILRHCRGFDQEPSQRRQSYVELLLRHEIDSTFTYTGYAWAAERARLWDPGSGRFRRPEEDTPPLALQLLILWSGLVLLLLFGPLLIALLNQLGPALVGLLRALTLGPPLSWASWTPLPLPLLGRWLLVVGALLVLLPFLLNRLLAQVFRPWPAQPDSDLRSVLKALYLQSRFLALAEQHQQQMLDGSASLRHLFRAFLKETQPNDRDAPSLRPGSIQMIRRTLQP